MKDITTAQEHKNALRELEALMVSDPPEGSDGDKRIDLLARVISDYEKRTVTLPKISPAELIRCVMENRGLKEQDLVPHIGSKRSFRNFVRQARAHS